MALRNPAKILVKAASEKTAFNRDAVFSLAEVFKG